MLRPLISCFALALFAVGCGGGSKPTKPNPPVTTFRAQPDHIDFGAVLLGAHRDTTFTVTNTGTTPINGALGDTSSQFILTGQAGLYLSPGQTGSYSVRFAPTRGGAQSAAIALADVGTLPLTGTGQAPPILACSVNPTTIDFGTVNVGQVVDRTFTLTNLSSSQMTGMVTDTSTAISVPGTGAYNLSPPQSATFVARFAPSAPRLRSTTIHTGQAGCPTVICTGTASAVCAVNPTSLDFGIVPAGTTASRTFTVTNVGTGVLTGGAGLTCDGYSMTGPDSYALNPGQSVTYTVNFSSIAEGLFQCTIPTGNASCSSVSCTAGSEYPCNCTVQPTTLAFGDVVVGSQANHAVTIGTGGVTAIAGTMTAVGDGLYLDAGSGLTKSYGYAANPGTPQSVSVVFAPSTLGSATGYVVSSQTLPTRIGSPCDTIRCSGTGITTPPPPQCALNTNNIQLGVFHSGATKDTTFTLSNTGGGTLSGNVSFLDATAAPFSLVGPTSYAIAAGQSQSFTLRYTAPSVPAGHTYSDVRMIDVGTGCPGLGPVSIGATAIP